MAALFSGLAAALVGAAFAIQPVLNVEISRSTGSALWAAMTSIAVSLLTLVLITLTGAAGRFPLAQFTGLPPWLLLGGVIGAGVVACSIWLTPIIGTAAFFAWLIAGQLIASLVIDHIGLLSVPVEPISLLRVVGVLMAIGGAVLVKLG
jgi:transporter family-2 protein